MSTAEKWGEQKSDNLKATVECSLSLNSWLGTSISSSAVSGSDSDEASDHSVNHIELQEVKDWHEVGLNQSSGDEDSPSNPFDHVPHSDHSNGCIEHCRGLLFGLALDSGTNVLSGVVSVSIDSSDAPKEVVNIDESSQTAELAPVLCDDLEQLLVAAEF